MTETNGKDAQPLEPSPTAPSRASRRRNMIQELYAFVAVGEDGNEGLCAFFGPDGWTPMVGADLERVDYLMEIARDTADVTQQAVHLVKFSKRTKIKLVQPRPPAELARRNAEPPPKLMVPKTAMHPRTEHDGAGPCSACLPEGMTVQAPTIEVPGETREQSDAVKAFRAEPHADGCRFYPATAKVECVPTCPTGGTQEKAGTSEVESALTAIADNLTTPQAVNDKLADALDAEGLDALAERARAGEFSDFSSFHPMPKMVLVEALRAQDDCAGCTMFIRRVQNGDFDG